MKIHNEINKNKYYKQKVIFGIISTGSMSNSKVIVTFIEAIFGDLYTTILIRHARFLY